MWQRISKFASTVVIIIIKQFILYTRGKWLLFGNAQDLMRNDCFLLPKNEISLERNAKKYIEIHLFEQTASINNINLSKVPSSLALGLPIPHSDQLLVFFSWYHWGQIPAQSIHILPKPIHSLLFILIHPTGVSIE